MKQQCLPSFYALLTTELHVYRSKSYHFLQNSKQKHKIHLNEAKAGEQVLYYWHISKLSRIKVCQFDI